MMEINLGMNFDNRKRIWHDRILCWVGKVLGKHWENFVQKKSPFDGLGLNKDILFGESLVSLFVILTFQINNHFVFFN